MSYRKFEVLKGLTLTKIDVIGQSEIYFTTSEGRRFLMYHEQDCCEDVHIEDICGDLQKLLGSPILLAEESSEDGKNVGWSGTWTFYKLANVKGSVTIRWYGESNGYYSENADFKEITK